MASPLLFGAVLGGAYLLWRKFNPSFSTRPSTPVGPSTKDPASGFEFQAQVVSSFADGSKMVDVFTKSGSRIVRFSQQGDDKSSRVEITSPPGVDPSIKAAALRVYGIRPKA
jgi:hypothetical protein